MSSLKMIVIIEKLNSDDERTVLTPARPCNFLESGYVIWSSISRGLRPIQSVKTITWFSLKSGMASTGVFSTANTPATVSAQAKISTKNRLRIENSMIRSIMLAFLALFEFGNNVIWTADLQAPTDLVARFDAFDQLCIAQL